MKKIFFLFALCLIVSWCWSSSTPTPATSSTKKTQKPIETINQDTVDTNNDTSLVSNSWPIFVVTWVWTISSESSTNLENSVQNNLWNSVQDWDNLTPDKWTVSSEDNWNTQNNWNSDYSNLSSSSDWSWSQTNWSQWSDNTNQDLDLKWMLWK